MLRRAEGATIAQATPSFTSPVRPSRGAIGQKGQPAQGPRLLSASDATYDETEGHAALSVLGNNVLNVDVAEFTFRPA